MNTVPEADWKRRMEEAVAAVHAAGDRGTSAAELTALVAHVQELDNEGDRRGFDPVPTGRILHDPPGL